MINEALPADGVVMSTPDPQIREALDAHPRGEALATLVRTVTLSAADERRLRFGDGLAELLGEAELAEEDGDVAGFNVIKALGRVEPPIARGRETVAALLARALLSNPPTSEQEATRMADNLCWLAANTYVDALWLLEDGEELQALWKGLVAVVREADERGSPQGRGRALCAAAALTSSTSALAHEAAAELRSSLKDPLLRSVFTEASGVAVGDDERVSRVAPVSEVSVDGELVPNPLGPLGLVLGCLTGFVVLRGLWRLFTVGLLRTKRPVVAKINGAGVTLDGEVRVMGRTIRSQSTHLPTTNLARAARLVRYPRLALYAGLLTLALGTFAGASLITDGARAGSPSLIALGAAIFGAGVLLDLLLSHVIPARTGRCRLLLVPRKGRSWAIATKDAAAADRALQTLSRTS